MAGPIIVLAGILFAYKILRGRLGEVKYKKNWHVIDDKTIRVFGHGGKTSVKMRLPVNPETGKFVKPRDIQAVGTTEGGELRVEIKHSVVDRNSRGTGNTR